MGRVRGFAFDIIIGVGGIGTWPTKLGIARKINWVGRHPIKSLNPVDARGPLAYFKKKDFRLFEQHGPLLSEEAPLLDKRVFGNRARFVFQSLTLAEQLEAEQLIQRILDLSEFDHLQLANEEKSTCTSACKPTFNSRHCSRLKKSAIFGYPFR